MSHERIVKLFIRTNLRDTELKTTKRIELTYLIHEEQLQQFYYLFTVQLVAVWHSCIKGSVGISKLPVW
jgi:hypothetical protein